MTVVAHAGHWAVQLAYLAPLVILGGAVAVGKVQERRARRDEDEPGSGQPSG